MLERGAIRERKYANQVKDFTKLRWGNITPTDLDGFIDFSDRLFVIIELKYTKADIPYGQRLALERMIDRWEAGGISAVALIATHNASPKEDIKVHAATVNEYRWKGRWIRPSRTINVHESIEIIRQAELSPIAS